MIAGVTLSRTRPGRDRYRMVGLFDFDVLDAFMRSVSNLDRQGAAVRMHAHLGDRSAVRTPARTRVCAAYRLSGDR